MNKFTASMDSLGDVMSDKFAPVANRVTANPWVKSVQEAIMAVVPLILVGSLITLVSILNNFIPGMPDLSPINRYTFGLMGLFVSFLIPYQVMTHQGAKDRSLVAGMTGVGVFLMMIGPELSEDYATISFKLERLGATGMFTAIAAGLIVGIVFNLFLKMKLFKGSTALPDFIIVWFDSLLPVLFCVAATWAIVDVAHFDIFAAIELVFSPLVIVAQSFWGFILYQFILAFLYSFGISPWVIYSLVYPVMLQGIQDNINAAAAGQQPIYINTIETSAAWLTWGGMGTTLPLVIMMAFAARSARLKAIGRATLVPSIFNINEPVVFGAPIVLNPLFMVPFWINTVIASVLTYGALASGLVPIPATLFQLWYMPAPLSTWIISPAVSSLILFAIIVILASLVWFPFVRAYDKQVLIEDADEEDEVPAGATGAAA